MRYSVVILPALLSIANARTNIFDFGALMRREVPQEHSHQKFLASVQTSLLKNNPAGIQDSVFGLLGDKAAATGAGKISDPSCLQQATADQAFTNAKAAGDVLGMTNALVYRALERNTGKVGLASAACTSIKAVNPEIAALKQHQDPASAGAAATNKAVTLELAKQIASVGGDPQTALLSGTFAPGSTSDNTGKGNTCDDANDAEGCIFTQNLLVEDATAAEIVAAVGGVAISSDTAASTTAAAIVTSTPATAVVATQAAATGAVDYGLCDPQMDFVAGRAGRKATEFTFLPIDPLTKQGQQDALNPNIITNRICDQLTNVCQSNQAAKDQCQQCKTTIAALGTRNAGTADAWNLCVIAGTNIAQDTSFDNESAATTAVNAASTVAAIVVTSAAVVTTAPVVSGGAATVTVTSMMTSISTVTVAGDCSATATSAAVTLTTASAGTIKANVQPFTGSLGVAPVPVQEVAGGRPFVVNGDSFVNFAAACQRSCDVQHNQCANAANAGGQTFSVSDCGTQQDSCNAGCSAGPAKL